MIKIATIQRYIESCDRIINNSKDPNEAKELEKEIVSVLGNDIKNIRNGLSRYMQRGFYGDETKDIDIDYIRDIRILRSKLQFELEKFLMKIQYPHLIINQRRYL